MSKPCSVDDCPNDHAARGFCISHYYHWRKNADPAEVKPRLAGLPPLERFWAQVDRTGTGCWEWTGCRVGRREKKYGHVTWEGRQQPASRVSWIIHHGPIPDGLVVRHKCDNPPCVRPDHLELGTVADNNADMWKRGTPAIPNLRGSRQNGAKLTEAQALDIRRRRAGGEPVAALSEEFGVSTSTIYKVAQGTRFIHV